MAFIKLEMNMHFRYSNLKLQNNLVAGEEQLEFGGLYVPLPAECSELYMRLQVAVNATHKDINRAFRILALRWHPDRHLDNMVEAEKQFKALEGAYSILSCPEQRSHYDRNNHFSV